jgi:hypothetical protein
MNAALANAARVVLGSCAAKKLARVCGIAVITAKKWLSEGVPASRHSEVSAFLLDELDRRNAGVRLVLIEVLENAGTVDFRNETARARMRARARAAGVPVHGDQRISQCGEPRIDGLGC